MTEDASAADLKPECGTWTQGALALAIVAITLLAYVPALRGGFVWDDYGFFIDNPLIEGPHGLRRLWLSTEPQDYFALTSTMLWAEWQAWGANPFGFHLVNVLLHAGAAILLWRVLRRLRVPGAWLGAAIFAVHPVATLSAAWITEGKNTLSMVLYLLALWAYLAYDERGGKARYGASLATYLLALLAKGSVVVLPFVLLLCAWWRRDRITRRDVWRSVPFFALALAMGLVTTWFQWHNAIRGTNVRPEGPASQIAASGWVAWFYLFKDLMPAGLTAIYPRWSVDGMNPAAWLPLLLLVGGMAWLWARRKTWGRAPFFCAAYFLIGILPVLGFLKMSFMPLSLVSDHFQYVAMVGITALAGGVLGRVSGRQGWTGRAGIAASAVCVAALAAATWNRAKLCGDEVNFWLDNVSKNSGSWFVRDNLAAAYQRTGEYEKAIAAADVGIKLRPDMPQGWFCRGNAYAALGRYELALADYDKALDTNPVEASQIYDNRAIAHARTHRDDLALLDYNESIRLKPDRGTPYNNRGATYARLATVLQLKGNQEEASAQRALALNDYDKAIERKPRFPDAYFNRGKAHADSGRLDEALADYSRAIELKPDIAAAYNNRAVIYFERKRYDLALADVKKFQQLGGKPSAQFLESLNEAAAQSAQTR